LPDGNDINFINENVTGEDREMFFGPLDGTEVFHALNERWTMANVMVIAGIFPSLSQARKQGEDKPIPEGWTHITRGKKARKKKIWILNIKE
jgi:hypothetical protein